MKLLAPIPRPRKNIFGIGLNYVEHVAESAKSLDTAKELPKQPVIFSKPPTAVIGPGDGIEHNGRITQQLDWEVELAVIIGTTARRVRREEALGHVFGYSVMIDVSARDNRRAGQWIFSKGLDTYASMMAAQAGKIRVAVLLGGNLFASNPDRDWARAALQRIGTTCSITTKLNEGHVHGRGRTHLLLPVLARDEERQATTQESMFNYVRLSDGREAPPAGELKSEVEVITALASRLLPPGPFPFDRMTRFEGLEGLEPLVADPKALRQSYLQVFQDHQSQLRKGCLANGADFRVLRTDTPLDVALTSYLSLRAKRGARR